MSEPTKMWNLAYIELLILELAAQFGTNLVNPIVSNFAIVLGASVSLAGVLVGVMFLIALILRPFGSVVFAHIDKAKLLLASAIMFAFASFLCAFVASVELLAVSRVIFGVAFVFKSALVLALAVLTTPKETSGRAVGIMGLANIIGAAVGPVVGSYLGAQFSYQVTYLASGICFVICIIMAIMVFRTDPNLRGQADSDEPRQSISEILHTIKPSKLVFIPAIPYAASMFFEGVVYGSVWSFMILMGETRGIEQVSLFFAVYTVVALVTRPFVTGLYDKLGLPKLFWIETLLMAIGAGVLAFAHDVVIVLVGAVTMALGQGALWPSTQAECVRGLSSEETTQAANTFCMGPDLGMFVGPMVCGVILDFFGFEAMYGFSFVCGILCGVVYYGYLAYKKAQARK